ncbi:MAG TPA: YggS family pyridoxal phosphate-dependent enzyme [Pirellulales bacterium]|jgi:hypothetical protein|nr:YggS family pyridoxal phosphate-dependent enzyme [Pirellulales bacterium]
MMDVGRLRENVERVRATIADATRRSGRQPADVTLVAVTKYVGAEVARQLVEIGCHDLGESRPQELWQKAAEVPEPAVRWHLIGHLQRNKTARTLEHAHLIHSADSWRLIETIDEAAGKRGQRAAVLIEVNTSGDATKGGFMPTDVEPLVEPLSRFGWIEVRGLMTMAAREGDATVARRNFADLRELAERLRAVSPATLAWQELSMGMSGDYEIAIAEGATIVRIGSALFEGIE